MNRRSFLRLLGVAPVAAPVALAAAARVVCETAPAARAYGVSMAIDGHAGAFRMVADDTCNGVITQLSSTINHLSTFAQSEISGAEALTARLVASENSIEATATAIQHLTTRAITYPHLTAGPVTITA